MKKFISLMLCVCILLLSSVSVFAVDWTNTDSSNLQNAANRLIYNGFSAARLLYDIDSTLSTISSTVSTINSRLFYGDHSISYYVSAINSYMNPIYLRLQDILKATTDPAFNAITSLLGYPTTDSGTGVTTWNSYLGAINDRDNVSGAAGSNIGIWYYSGLGNMSYLNWTPPSNWRKTLISLIQTYDNNQAIFMGDMYNSISKGYNTSQSFINWHDLSAQTFAPTSFSNGVYTWFSKLQEPVARLSYVLASDERIEAQEKAADNEQAVVDNFIDSSGSGAASTSDFGSVSDLSSGFKNNIATDANVSGIWNIFNSENFGWFSQETADQLDTSNSNTKTLKSSGSYPTPLLDQQTEDILKYIGGDKK